jgi:hypothetical protein
LSRNAPVVSTRILDLPADRPKRYDQRKRHTADRSRTQPQSVEGPARLTEPGDDSEITGTARDPLLSAFFDANWYLGSYPDVRASGMKPLEHYTRLGWKEGRNPSAAFNGERYLDDNPDVRAAGISPLRHYLAHGRAENRPVFDVLGKRRESIASLVDREWYVAARAEAIEDPYFHYMTVGAAAGAAPNAFFDGSWYLQSYPDVRDRVINPLEHYALFGWKQGRNPCPAFDGERYLDDNPDVRAAGVSPLHHYLHHGRFENRRIFAVAERASRPKAPPAPRKVDRFPVAWTRNDEGDRLDKAIMGLLRRLAAARAGHGPIAAVLVASRLGEDNFALGSARSHLRQNPGTSALLLVADDDGIPTDAPASPPNIHIVRIADFVEGLESSASVEFLLRILQALRPEIFHIVDSDLGWFLLAQQGKRAKALTRIVGSLGPQSSADAELASVARYYCDEILADGRSGGAPGGQP